MNTTEFGIYYSPHAGIDTAPSYYDSIYPAEIRQEYEKEWHEEHDPTVVREPLTEQTIYAGNDWDDLRPYIWTFFESGEIAQAKC